MPRQTFPAAGWRGCWQKSGRTVRRRQWPGWHIRRLRLQRCFFHTVGYGIAGGDIDCLSVNIGGNNLRRLMPDFGSGNGKNAGAGSHIENFWGVGKSSYSRLMSDRHIFVVWCSDPKAVAA